VRKPENDRLSILAVLSIAQIGTAMPVLAKTPQESSPMIDFLFGN
jgi:hypothetical protein